MTTPPPARRGDPSDADAERIGAWLDGDLDAGEAERLERRLADEPALRARLERIRAVRERLADAEGTEVPEGFVGATVERATAPAEAPVVPLWRRRAWVPAAAAAAILLGLLLATPVLLGPVGQDDALEDADAPPQTAEAPEAEGDVAPEAEEEAAPEEDEDDAAPEEAEDDVADDVEALEEEAAPEDDDPADHALGDLGAVASVVDLVERVAEAPVVADQVGLDREEAEALDARTMRALARGSVAGDGADRCAPQARDRAQDELSAGEALTAVAVVGGAVEDQPLLAHAFVAGPENGPTQRVLVVVTEEAPDCAVREVAAPAP